MIDADAFAVLIADWCLEVQPGQQILIETTTLAAGGCGRAAPCGARARGAGRCCGWRRPGSRPTSSGTPATSSSTRVAPIAAGGGRGRRRQRADHGAGEHERARGRRPALIGAPGARAGAAAARRGRASAGALSIWPTPALAEQAGMGEREYAEFVERALFLDRPDPVAAWRALRDQQARVIERLAPAREIRIETAGTDLHAERRGAHLDRTPTGAATCPAARSSPARTSTRPTARSASTCPRPAAGPTSPASSSRSRTVRSWPRAPSVGDEHLQAALATDAGARFLGELGIGTNTGIDRATGSTLLDEKIAGTMHLALGQLVSGDRRPERVGAALGPDLRPAQGRSRHGRRRGADPRWAVCR